MVMPLNPVFQPQIVPGTGVQPGVSPTDVTQALAWLEAEQTALQALAAAIAADPSAPAYATQWATGLLAGANSLGNFDTVKTLLTELVNDRQLVVDGSTALQQAQAKLARCVADNAALNAKVQAQSKQLAAAPPPGQLPAGAVSTGAAAAAGVAGLIVGGLGGYIVRGALKKGTSK